MVEVETKTPRYEHYKDSGVEWLGEIPEHWEMKRFKFLANANKGKLPKNIVSINNDSLPPYMSMEYLRGGEENQWVKDKDALIIDENEILLLWDGSNSGEFLKSRKGVISSTVAHIIFNNIDQKFSWYHSKVLEVELRKNTIGMGIPHVNGRVLNNLIMLLPSLPEQTKIAQFLDDKTTKIDQAIAIKEQQINLLKERKQLLIHKAVTRGLDDSVTLKDSGVEWIGEIPVHWDLVPVRRLIDVRDGTHDTPTYVEEEQKTYPLVTSKDFVEGEINFNNIKRISEKDHLLISSRSGVKKNDVLMSMIGGNIGKSIIVGDNDEFSIKNVALFRTRDNSVLGKFLMYYFQSGILDKQIELKSRGGAQGFLSLGDIRNLVFFKIENIELNEIIKFLDDKTKKIETDIGLKQQEIEKLKEYKSSLINGVVTGKVKVC